MLPLIRICVLYASRFSFFAVEYLCWKHFRLLFKFVFFYVSFSVNLMKIICIIYKTNTIINWKFNIILQAFSELKKTLQHQEAEEYKFSLKTVHNTKKLEYRRVESWNLPLVNGPRSPPRFAELQSLYLLARSSNLSVPDVIRLW